VYSFTRFILWLFHCQPHSQCFTGKDESKKALSLFGPVLSVSVPTTVTICGFCKNSGKHTAQAGVAVFFGNDSDLNRSVRVWGNQNNARADLVALLLAVKVAPKTKNLVISTRSEYAIRSITYYVYKNDACGWTCVNGDIEASSS
jgi:ribonuclease HI